MVLQKQNKTKGSALRNVCNGVYIIHTEGKNYSAESTYYAVFKLYAFKKIFNHQNMDILYVMGVLYIFFQKTATFNKRLILKNRKLLAFKYFIV